MKRCTQCGKRKRVSEFYFVKARNKERAECKECSSLRAANWAKDHRDRVNKTARKWRRNNPEKVKEVSRKNSIKRKQICIIHYGKNGGCVCCGETELCFLTIDHIKDNGAKDKKKYGPGERLRYWMIIKDKFPKGLQTLCFNCQWGKRIHKGFCPHHPRTDLRKS
jgi:hypothetical protein